MYVLLEGRLPVMSSRRSVCDAAIDWAASSDRQ